MVMQQNFYGSENQTVDILAVFLKNKNNNNNKIFNVVEVRETIICDFEKVSDILIS